MHLAIGCPSTAAVYNAAGGLGCRGRAAAAAADGGPT